MKTIEELIAAEGGWWVDPGDGEGCYGGPRTREELDPGDDIEPGDSFDAIRAIIVGVRLSEHFDMGSWLESITDYGGSLDAHTCQESAASPTDAVTPEQHADLQASIRDAIDAWQVRHQLRLESMAFDSIAERVAMKKPEGGDD